MTNDQIFNQKALDKLRSPDKLDSMIRITGPVGWMGLVAVAVLCFAIVLWSVYGSFTEKADGQGLILDSAGMVTVTHASAGKVTDVYVVPGNLVKKGDLIGRVEQPEASADMRMAEYGTGLATDDRDLQSRVYQYDAMRHQQTARSGFRITIKSIRKTEGTGKQPSGRLSLTITARADTADITAADTF